MNTLATIRGSLFGLVCLLFSLAWAQAGPPGSATAPLDARRLIEPVAANACSSTSSLSRRCHFTFGSACKARKESPEHCTRMLGYCHSCTDQYVACKSSHRSKGCAPCNTAYDGCIRTMVKTYGGKLIKAR